MRRVTHPNRGSRCDLGSAARAGGVMVAIALLLQWAGCSVEKNYDLLNKFFDGVPDPNAVGPQGQAAIAMSSTYTEHQPYTDDSCFQCHPNPSEMLLTKDDSDICLRCHEGLNDQYPLMHGAVTGMACLMCHDPHFSAYEHLLREEAPGLCLQCHDMGTGNPTPPHKDLQQNCLECHNGHGGDVPFFLREQNDSKQSDPNTLQLGD